MKAYLQAFVNFKQNNCAKRLPIAEFAYNNAKNTSTNHMSFKLNYSYHPWMSYKKKFDPRSKFKLAEKLSAELKELMILCRENLYHTQELQK